MDRYINYMLVNFQAFLKMTYFFGYPYIMNIDTTNICNLRCPFCTVGARSVRRDKGVLSVSQFARVMEIFGRWLYQLNLYLFGEPLLNKDIVEMVKIAKRRNIKVHLSSNFNILSEEMAEGLVTSGLDSLILSIDGVTQESYEKYRVGGNLETVLDNVRLLTRKKAELVSETPRLIWQFLVFKHNVHEIEKAKTLARDLGIEFTISEPYVPRESGSEWRIDRVMETEENPLSIKMSKTSLFRKHIFRRNVCAWPWKGIAIAFNGGVLPCCIIQDEELDYGNIYEDSYARIRNNRKYRNSRRSLRRYTLRIPFIKPDNKNLCIECSFKQSSIMTGSLDLKMDYVKAYYMKHVSKFKYMIKKKDSVENGASDFRLEFQLEVLEGNLSLQAPFFDSTNLKLGVKLFGKNMVIVKEYARIDLPTDLSPGKNVKFELAIPRDSTAYYFKFDFVKENRFWLEDLGLAPCFHRIM